MTFPSQSTVDDLKRVWTDRFVTVKADARPELKRFEGRVGRVVTVNYGGRAIVDFADGAWYDIPKFEEVLDTVTDDAEKEVRCVCDFGTAASGAGKVNMILLIDNYDSFTFNLVQRFGEIDRSLDMKVVRNDQLTLDDIQTWKPSHIVISPGPCTPKEAGISNDVLSCFASRTPILGVCLGHQCIGHTFGGEVIRNRRIMHGKVSPIHHDGKGVFAGLSNPFDATRYHSLVIKRETWTNPDFEVSAWTAENEIMGVRHKTWPLHGVQFHPESFLTVEGPKLLRNFLAMKA